ncbi:myoD family inhibitor domain-containing protein [Chanos chanos]|uniref:MyoD family inhibitor domain-containing protein n=1 Tax=Chanos chanos TaxID=29144 RepID=A0A6J2W948_CHACN|nr:myoD family inhibitor domain-containing protein-like [Chanos chanos]
MDLQLQGGGNDSGQDRSKTSDNHEKPITALVATEATGDCAKVTPEDNQGSDRKDHRASDESLTDVVSTNDCALLLPNHKPAIPLKTEKEDPSTERPNLPNGHTSLEGVSSGAPPICTPPSRLSGQMGPLSSQPQTCNGHSHSDKKRLPSSTKSQKSFKANATQIQQVAGDDCCVHCVLACLFCEATSLCSALSQCLACGQGCEALCCCGEAATEGLACCGEDACSAILDCAILEDCCQSSDCLEICLECCSICFPA